MIANAGIKHRVPSCANKKCRRRVRNQVRVEVNRLFNNFFGESALPRMWHGMESAFAVTPALDALRRQGVAATLRAWS